jgi:hypothetical protein
MSKRELIDTGSDKRYVRRDGATGASTNPLTSAARYRPTTATTPSRARATAATTGQ